jgi:hypothetical protein
MALSKQELENSYREKLITLTGDVQDDLLDYDTNYRFTAPNIIMERDGVACFSDLYVDLENKYRKNLVPKAVLGITLHTPMSYKGGNNLSLVPESLVALYMSLVSKVVPMTYRIEVSKDLDIDIEITMTGNLAQFKWVSTVVRYLYEFPFNMIISDLLILWPTIKVKGTTIFDFFNEYLGILSNFSYRYSNHSVPLGGGYSNPISSLKLKKFLKNNPSMALNQLHSNVKDVKRIESSTIYLKRHRMDIADTIENWCVREDRRLKDLKIHLVRIVKYLKNREKKKKQ